MWYYDELVQAYREAGTRGYLMDELNRVVRKLHARDRDLPDERGGGAQ